MADDQHFQTAPEDRIPLGAKLVYGLGAFVNNLLAAASGGMMVVLNVGLGISPTWVGVLTSLPRITDAFTDPLMGYISDHTRTRWGRRRPYIFCGAIAVGILFALMWQLPRGQSDAFYIAFFLAVSTLMFAAYTAFATPWVALGYELTPDYHERTRLMGVQNAFGQFAFVIAPWFLAFMEKDWFTDIVEGASVLAWIIGGAVIALGVLPAVFLRERPVPTEPTDASDESAPRGLGGNLLDFFRGFGAALKLRPFLLLCAASFLIFNGFMLVSSFGYYVIRYYVCAGDADLGAYWAGWSGMVGGLSSFGVVVLVTWASQWLGKRRTLVAATVVCMGGHALKWVCYDPSNPVLAVLPAPLTAFGLGALFTLVPSMIADVVDLDEVATHERREGMFGAIFWWIMKLGVAAAALAGGLLLDGTGFDVDLGGAQSARTLLLMRVFDVAVPIASSAIAIVAILAFPITEARAHEIRAQLERRRGK